MDGATNTDHANTDPANTDQPNSGSATTTSQAPEHAKSEQTKRDEHRKKTVVMLSVVSAIGFVGLLATGAFNKEKQRVDVTGPPVTVAAAPVAVDPESVAPPPGVEKITNAHESQVQVVSWSPDGSRFASGGVEPDPSIFVWDATSLAKLATLSGHTAGVYGLAWSPDSKMIATGSWDNSVRIFDAGSGAMVKQLSGHTDAVEGVAWSPDGATLASVSWDQTLRLWNVADGANKATYKGQAAPLYSVAWSPDGTQLVTGGDDGTVADGETTITEGIVRVFDAATGTVTQTFEEQLGPINAVAWSPDSKSIALGGLRGSVRLWNPSQGETRVVVNEPLWVRSLAWSTNSKLAVAKEDGAIAVWNIGTTQVEQSMQAHDGGPTLSLAWSPDGSEIVSGGKDKAITVNSVNPI
jgi:WD40 repeat protein